MAPRNRNLDIYRFGGALRGTGRNLLISKREKRGLRTSGKPRLVHGQVLRIRGERALAREAAAKQEAEQKAERIAKLRADPAAPRVQFETGTPRLTAQQVAETAAAYRANNANCDEELRNLMEARLVAALQADGYAIPPQRPADRLRALKSRQLR